jgi:hypothetical protein
MEWWSGGVMGKLRVVGKNGGNLENAGSNKHRLDAYATSVSGLSSDLLEPSPCTRSDDATYCSISIGCVLFAP